MIAHADVQKPPALSRTMVVSKPNRALKPGYHWVFETVGTTHRGSRWAVIYRWVMVKGPAPIATGAGTINLTDNGGFAS